MDLLASLCQSSTNRIQMSNKTVKITHSSSIHQSRPTSLPNNNNNTNHINPASDKRAQKRAANRKSAQLSRKRKKEFVEELQEQVGCGEKPTADSKGGWSETTAKASHLLSI